MNNQSIVRSPRGTKDILPDDSVYWKYIEIIARNTLSTYSYREIRTPLFEETTLFKRGIGEGTDIVNKEMYTFLDQAQRELTLRPEGTAGVVRAFIEKQMFQAKAINRLWYQGPMFRYERPQSGRQRQFHQLGVELLGSDNSLADAEVISVALDILKSLNVEDVTLEINSIGDFHERQHYLTALKEFLNEYKQDLDPDSLSKLEINPLRILDTKNTKTKEILLGAPILKTYLNSYSQQHFESLLCYLTEIGIDYKVNNRLVRGLDYYTYTAFEIKAKHLGAQDTICGGGRYNHLVKQLQGPNTPAVGWGMGLERLILLLNQPLLEKSTDVDFYIANVDNETSFLALKTAQGLRQLGFTTELDITYARLQKQLKRATKINARGVIILGLKELQNNFGTIKWLKSGNQSEFPLSNLSVIKKLYLQASI
uniref:histidine-tRNA synthetase n=1 Tax=Timspurckia oligopyrenoides TaxID=708627 RepID=UPI001FCDC770|nr:histidine-tRNA synthetase [Timspurckia oligopyrenoides]UNJ17464.1 histidine-tRNA synthetase [Timspurckia oligopyrenoides]